MQPADGWVVLKWDTPRLKQTIFILAAILLMCVSLRAQDALFVHFSPPDVMPDADNRLAAIAAELDNPADANAVADAALRFETFMSDSKAGPGGGLIGEADGTEIWTASWLRQLSEPRRHALAAAMQTRVGDAAQQALDDARNNPATDPIDAYAIARRYPLTTVAVEALRYAAERFRLLGDSANADAMEALAENRPSPTPNIVGEGVPFNAPWSGSALRSAWTAMRTWPMTAGAITFVVGPTQVVALSASAAVLWHGPIGEEAAAGSGAANPAGFTRGPMFAPALFAVKGQPPAIVVVRQPAARGNGWAVRAVRGSDGRLLWSTESNAEMSRLLFASTPLIAGRYVYVVAGEPGDDLDRLALIALELTTGRQLWRCDFGSVSHPTPNRHGRPADTSVEPYRPWMNQSAPAVSGDEVLLAPDVGEMIAVDRFDGSLRWLHPYTPIGLPITDVHRSALEAAVAARAAQQHRRPGDPTGLPIRWNNTPAIVDQTVVVAPQDTASALAFDIYDGRLLWETSQVPALNPGKLDAPIESLSPFTLVGIHNKTAILQGDSLVGLALDDGHVAVRSDALPNCGGPASIRDGRILVPSKDRGVFGYADLMNPVPAPIPLFNELLKTDAVRKALQANDSISSFTLPK